MRRLVGRFADRALLRACYEAGPGGYDLYRLLSSMGVACEVVAPSLIPKGGSGKVKTDKRDSRRLARLHRAGELTAIRAPMLAEEAVRDRCGVRAAVLADRNGAQQRLTAVLMRHGRIWRSSYWTAAHRAWIGAQRFAEPGAGVGGGILPGHAADARGRAGRGRGRADAVGGPGAAGARRGPAGLLPGHRRSWAA